MIDETSWIARARGDDGVATVLGAVMIAALIVAAVMVVDVGAAVSARHRAQSAADMSALSGAAAAIDAEAACAAAGRLAAENSAGLTACAVENDFEVVVQVQVPVSFAMFGSRTAQASARAGPA